MLHREGEHSLLMERWRTNLWALWTAQVLAMVAMSAVIPFLPLFIRELGVHNNTLARQWSGLIFAAPFFTSLIASPIWGALADKYSRKTMVVRAVLGIAVALVLMGFSRSVQELFVWRLVQGGISGFIAAALGFVVAETPTAQRGYAIGVLQTSQSIGAVVGPFLGGTISQYAGMRAVFGVMSALCVISCAVVITAVQESAQRQHSHQERVSVVDNLRYAWRIPGFMFALTCIVLSQMGTIMPSPQMPYYLEELGVPATHLQLVTGVVVGITGLSTLVAAPWVGKQVDRRGPRIVVQWSAIGAACMLLVQAVAWNVGVLMIARALFGVALSGLVPALNAYVSIRIPDGRQSGMMSLASSAMLLGNLLAPPVGGQLSAHIGLRAVFLAASLCTASIPALLWWVRRSRLAQNIVPQTR